MSVTLHTGETAAFSGPLSMADALHLIRGHACESFTTGLGSCFRNGRTPYAYYGAERCCPSCIAHYALERGA